ncbi:MAG: hypothetical protein ACW99Q_15050 [Candidatus Kariarchaeaceae archaeon]|jgi:hypothetical protein
MSILPYRKKWKLFLITVGLTLTVIGFNLYISGVSGHEIKEKDLQTLEFDVSPQFETVKYGNFTIIIEKDITTFSFGSTHYFTTQHILHGHIRFSNPKIDNNGMDNYKTVLKTKVYFEPSELNFPSNLKDIELGTKSQVLSNSAIRDGELDFVYFINGLEDIDWNPSYDAVSMQDLILSSNYMDRINFTIAQSIEFHRSSNNNATFDISHQIGTMRTIDIPTEVFHHRLIMNTTLIPETFRIDVGLSIAETKTVFLFLPDELIPRYFKFTKEHKLNLSKIPALIRLRLELSTSENKFLRGFSVNKDGINGLRTTRSDFYEEFKLKIDLDNSPLLPITIKAVSYTGEIRIKAQIEISSLWSDKGLYAKNEYLLSPNTYLGILVIAGTIFTYKVVAYAEYRIFQNILAKKNYDIVEKEFMN